MFMEFRSTSMRILGGLFRRVTSCTIEDQEAISVEPRALEEDQGPPPMLGAMV
jgi:hypothetical protein